MYVCMYVCMYVGMYVCMYVRTYVRMYVCMYICMYVCMYYVCVCVYSHSCVHFYFIQKPKKTTASTYSVRNGGRAPCDTQRILLVCTIYFVTVH